MDKSAEEKLIKALGDIMHDFVKEQYGEEVERDLDKMAEYQMKIHMCMRHCIEISLDDVDRYNQLVRKHFTKKDEK